METQSEKRKTQYSGREQMGGNAIEMNGVHKKLDGRRVLDGLSLQIHKGEIHVIIGGSGAGKSVTLKMIVGLLKPDRGSITVCGLVITGKKGDALDEVRKRIGYLFQGSALLNSINVYENVALPLREHEEITEERMQAIIHEKLAMVGLPESDAKMPSNLSGGMKKRVGLARALVLNPEVLLYDEPTSGLDPISARAIEELIVATQKKLGGTSIVVTHDMESAFRMADRVSMLYQGKILETAPPDDFKRSENPIIRRFINGELHE